MNGNILPVIEVNEIDSQRDRSRRFERGNCFSDVDSNNQRDRSDNRIASQRIYVSNIPCQYRCQELKELFLRIVGTVEFVEMFLDQSNKPNGCGMVQFQAPEGVQKALEKMNHYEVSGREIVVTVDHAEKRDKYGRIVGVSGVGGGVGVVTDGVSNGVVIPLARPLHANTSEYIGNRTNIMREHLKHWNKVPTLEDVKTEYIFKIKVFPRLNKNCLFKDGKVYVNINSVLAVDVLFKPPTPDSPNLFLRAIIVFSNKDEIHLPVKRCVNHRATNKGVLQEHILKCFRPKTLYMGNENFKSFGKRLSILIPLEYPRVRRHGWAIKNHILLQFLCGNSCTGINNKNTAVIFTLEDNTRKIYGKKVLPFKVSTDP